MAIMKYYNEKKKKWDYALSHIPKSVIDDKANKTDIPTKLSDLTIDVELGKNYDDALNNLEESKVNSTAFNDYKKSVENNFEEKTLALNKVKELATSNSISLEDKVDKVEGKDLSTNDFTDDFKSKVLKVNLIDSLSKETNQMCLDLEKSTESQLLQIKTTLDSKADKTKIPTKLSQLEKDIELGKNYDAEITTLTNSKVTKVSGKGLSTNDFTNDYKAKVTEIPQLKTQINKNKTDISKKISTVNGKGGSAVTLKANDLSMADGKSVETTITTLNQSLNSLKGNTMSAGLGLRGGGSLGGNRSFYVDFGTGSNQVARGNHTHPKTGGVSVSGGQGKLTSRGDYVVVGDTSDKVIFLTVDDYFHGWIDVVKERLIQTVKVRRGNLQMSTLSYDLPRTRFADEDDGEVIIKRVGSELILEIESFDEYSVYYSYIAIG